MCDVCFKKFLTRCQLTKILEMMSTVNKVFYKHI